MDDNHDPDPDTTERLSRCLVGGEVEAFVEIGLAELFGTSAVPSFVGRESRQIWASQPHLLPCPSCGKFSRGGGDPNVPRGRGRRKSKQLR